MAEVARPDAGPETGSGGAAREVILARVRAATGFAVPVARERPPHRPTAGSVDLFVERVEDYQAVVERCVSAELAERVAAAVAGRTVVVPDGLSIEVPGAVVDTGLTALDLDRIDVVVTEATLGIAETGTIVAARVAERSPWSRTGTCASSGRTRFSPTSPTPSHSWTRAAR